MGVEGLGVPQCAQSAAGRGNPLSPLPLCDDGHYAGPQSDAVPRGPLEGTLRLACPLPCHLLGGTGRGGTGAPTPPLRPPNRSPAPAPWSAMTPRVSLRPPPAGRRGDGAFPSLGGGPHCGWCWFGPICQAGSRLSPVGLHPPARCTPSGGACTAPHRTSTPHPVHAVGALCLGPCPLGYLQSPGFGAATARPCTAAWADLHTHHSIPRAPPPPLHTQSKGRTGPLVRCVRPKCGTQPIQSNPICTRLHYPYPVLPAIAQGRLLLASRQISAQQ
mmetsp:Transcript_52435/g.93603  ORF Transcript_52435/g.93603 Transcript_52435/m.93603 type:complete len:274 (+) Transcript_52435:999-1820(+)